MSFLGQEEQLREYQDRFRYMYAALFIGIGLILARLTYLQILNGDVMRRYSEENRIKRVKIVAPRGMIFDRNRTLLVDNQPSFDLEITPQYLRESKQEKEVLERLSALIDEPVSEISKKLEKSKTQPAFLPIKIKTQLQRDEVAKIETWKLDMPGVAVETEIQRTNIYGEVGSHLLGYIGKISEQELPAFRRKGLDYAQGDSIGKFGIEKELESTLRGIDGQEVVEVDALGRRIIERPTGRVLTQTKEVAAIPGKNLVLTIDQDLQLAAEKAFGDKAGGLVAIDPRSGEILAMVSKPSFNSTEFSRSINPALWKQLLENEDRPLRDKTIQDHYPPGSVFKAVTAVAGLEDGLINENTKIHCAGSIRVGNRVYHCHRKGGHGEVDVVTALERSCDVFFYRLAQRFKSVDDIAKWAIRLGLGKKTGIQLSREVPGLAPTEAWKLKRFGQVWTQGEVLSVAIGQSFVLSTVIQLANLYAAIGNGGTLFNPFFIKTIESYDGSVLKEFSPKASSETRLSPKTTELLRKGLLAVVNSPGGTAYGSRLPGVLFAGKTGTSQVVRLSADKIYQKCENMKYRFRHHGLFAGFAPANNPVIAVAAIAEHACHGSTGAAPVVREVIRTYLKKYHPDMIKADPEGTHTPAQTSGAVTPNPNDE